MALILTRKLLTLQAWTFSWWHMNCRSIYTMKYQHFINMINVLMVTLGELRPPPPFLTRLDSTEILETPRRSWRTLTTARLPSACIVLVDQHQLEYVCPKLLFLEPLIRMLPWYKQHVFSIFLLILHDYTSICYSNYSVW